MRSLIIITLFLTSMAQISLAKGDPQKGATKVATCMACHGPKGVSSNDLWPNLAGQKYGYLVKQIKDFKSGARKDPLMGPQAVTINDSDIEDIAAYFSSLN